jgi:hypothetical protein
VGTKKDKRQDADLRSVRRSAKQIARAEARGFDIGAKLCREDINREQSRTTHPGASAQAATEFPDPAEAARQRKRWELEQLPLSLQCKLGSLCVHVEEAFLDPKGHPFDLDAMKSILVDTEYKAWIERLRAGAFIPVKR